MAKVEIYHNYLPRKIKQQVFATDHIDGGLHMMDIFTRYWEQDAMQYHTIKINGRWKKWADVYREHEASILGHRMRGKREYEQRAI